MSYDLIVRGQPYVPLDQIRALFKNRPWMEIDGDPGGVLITNTNTGVYYTISEGDRKKKELLYSINYNRPRFFALEALDALAGLVERFAWNIFDPQRDAALTFAQDELDATLSRWQRENDAVTWPANGRPTIAAQRAHSVWEWNYRRPDLDSAPAVQALQIYVPRIFFVRSPGDQHARTILIWPKEVHAIALPDVDAIVYRPESAHRGWTIDRKALLDGAAYYRVEVPDRGGVCAVNAPRFSLLLSTLEKAKREAFAGEIVPSDALVETA